MYVYIYIYIYIYNDKQNLSGCQSADLSPGECTNCSTVHCDSGYQLVNCSNITKCVCVCVLSSK